MVASGACHCDSEGDGIAAVTSQAFSSSESYVQHGMAWQVATSGMNVYNWSQNLGGTERVHNETNRCSSGQDLLQEMSGES